jgi:hypothetical protein
MGKKKAAKKPTYRPKKTQKQQPKKQQPRQSATRITAPRPTPKTGSSNSLLAKAGGELGTLFGMPTVGRIAGSLISRITGMGAYSIRRNTMLTGAPQFGRMPGTLRFQHREYLGDITGSTAYANNVYPINPGLDTTFPFLAGIAAQFQQYRFHGLVFYYNSTSASALNSTNTALGTVIMCTDYDSIEPVMVSKAQMEQCAFTNSSRPDASAIHGVECDPRQSTLSELYVRNGAVPAGTDQRFYDLGVFQLATSGMQAAADIGELWVSYDVELMKPRLTSSSDADPYFVHLVASNANTCSAGSPFGTSGLVATSGSTFGAVTATGGGTVTVNLPSGTFLVTFVWAGSGASITTTPSMVLAASGATFNSYTDLNNNTAAFETSFTTTTAQFVYALQVTTPGGIKFTPGGLASMTTANVDVYFLAAPPTFTLAAPRRSLTPANDPSDEKEDWLDVANGDDRDELALLAAIKKLRSHRAEKRAVGSTPTINNRAYSPAQHFAAP